MVRVAVGVALLACVIGMMIYAVSRAQRISEANAGLLMAANNGRLEAIATALRNGADINVQDDYGVTPLIGAMRGDAPECARLLLHRGASVTPCAKVYGTALAWAACHGHLDLVREMLQSGADPNADSDGYGNPLQLCALCPHDSGVEVAKALIAAGADVHRRDSKGHTPAETARLANNGPVLDLLLAYQN
jgi:ankyrin repeat protein